MYFSTYTSCCFSAEPKTNFAVMDVNDSIGIDVNVGNNTIVHLTLSKTQAEVLLDSLDEYITEKAWKEFKEVSNE
jgi:hypothetical protein